MARTFRRVVGYLWTCAGNDKRFVHDAAQDSFIEIERRWENPPYLRYEPARDNYLLKTARRKLALYNADVRNDLAEQPQMDPRTAVTSSIEEWLIEYADLISLIKVMPPQQREAFVLHRILDLSQEQTAKIMEIRRGTVKTYIQRAMEAITQEQRRRTR